MTKKLYLSIMTLILMIFSTSTATYAWLSMATSNSVQGLSLTTNLGDKLEISVDGINYYESLPSEILIEKISGLSFTDITSIDGKTFSHGIKQNELQPIKNKEYISIDFYFRTVSPYLHEVYLANNISQEVTYEEGKVGTFITSKGRYWVSDIDFLYGPDEIMQVGVSKRFYVKDAMRISFIEHGNDQKQKIFDLSGNEERSYAKPYGAHAYYTEKKGNIPLPKEKPDTIYKLSEFDVLSPYALDTNSHILSLKYVGHKADNGQYLYEGKVTMNIWVEGWDADLFDAVFGDQVKMQFQFKAVIGLKS